MNSKEIFNFLFEKFESNNVDYVILHSYQKLPERFDSDIDIAINVPKIEDAINLLDRTLKGTGWRVIQFWRHEYYAADCVISNDVEFLQVDFCTHYERNGRVVMSAEELVTGKKKYRNFYIPAAVTEFTYILVKKVLKKNFSKSSREHLSSLWNHMTNVEKAKTMSSLQRFFDKKRIDEIISKIESNDYDNIDTNSAYRELRNKTSAVKADLSYVFFDIKRKIERIIHPTGLFIVLLGVDGAGKTTIASLLKERYITAFRRISHYHSRVRVLKDLSQIKSGNEMPDARSPHGKKHRSGKLISVVKFGYYFLDYLIGNIIITQAKIRSSLVLIERYYYDYTIDKVRYNLSLSERFLKFFGRFVKKPDVVFILTGDSKALLERKHEITIEEIDEQKNRLKTAFCGKSNAVFIDTVDNSADECINQMIRCCNNIMRERRKWD